MLDLGAEEGNERPERKQKTGERRLYSAMTRKGSSIRGRELGRGTLRAIKRLRTSACRLPRFPS